jgi:hypothetical protein
MKKNKQNKITLSPSIQHSFGCETRTASEKKKKKEEK